MRYDENDTPQLAPNGGRRAQHYHVLIPVALALVMAAPSVRGGFLTGDDVHLVRDHVLVNHPSVDHLAKLFTIPHRDLYQPIPLATFAVNFAMIRWLGLAPTAAGPDAGAWVFHLTNVLIHALNALLVWRLIRGVTGRAAPALATGVLFAVHPLNVECVAWLSGRMMMLSATFTLASLIAADRAFHRPTVGHLLVTVLLTGLAMMSKVSVGLPVLMLLIPFVRRRRPVGRWWVMFASAVMLTVFLALLNFELSRGQFDTAGEALEGSRLVRTVIALGWYAGRYFVPIGLAPWHPTEIVITAAHPCFLPAAVVVAGLLAGSVLLLRYSRAGAAGVIWFFATIAVTLPLVPSRNLMVAERYAYLPAVGFHWIIAAGCVWAVGAVRRRGMTRAAVPLVAGVLALASAVLIGVAWKTVGYYRDNVVRCRRTAELYPDHEGVWTRLAWAHYDAGEHESAVEAATVELKRHPQSAESDVWQVQGMALLRSGAVEEALARLAAAVETDPDAGMPRVRLATALTEAGRLDDAVRHYRRAVETMPGYNPGIIGLAQTYRRLGRPDEAAEMFERALVNNPYDPIAATNLAEIELSAGHVTAAAERLEKLLRWMPENAAAHTNLGICYLRLGRTGDALHAYRAALAHAPTLVPPRLNLAMLLDRTGATEEAAFHFSRAAEHSGHADAAVLLPYSDFLIARGDFRRAAAVWTKGMERNPGDVAMASWYAWVCVLAERWGLARQVRASLSHHSALGTQRPTHVAAALAGILLDVHSNRPERAAEAVSKLCEDGSAVAREARDRLEHALNAYSGRHAESPWSYYVMIMLFQGDGRTDDARLALEAFEQVCTDAAWTQRAQSLVTGASSQPAGVEQ